MHAEDLGLYEGQERPCQMPWRTATSQYQSGLAPHWNLLSAMNLFGNRRQAVPSQLQLQFGGNPSDLLGLLQRQHQGNTWGPWKVLQRCQVPLTLGPILLSPVSSVRLYCWHWISQNCHKALWHWQYKHTASAEASTSWRWASMPGRLVAEAASSEASWGRVWQRKGVLREGSGPCGGRDSIRVCCQILNRLFLVLRLLNSGHKSE